MTEQIALADDRFTINVDGRQAGFAQFRDEDGTRVFFHTVVDDAHAGQGLAGRLVAHALDATRAEELRVSAPCSYVQHFIDKHPEYADLLAAPR